MGWWSKIKRAVKAIVRAVVRAVVIVVTAPIKTFDLVFGWLGWPPKKLRLHIAVLQSPTGPLLTDLNDLRPSIDLLQQVLKDRCNVNVLPYSSGNKNEIDNWAQVLTGRAPNAALHVRCDEGAVWDEGGEAGEYFAQNTAGWVGSFIPISLAFPVTIFIVEEVAGKVGCAVPVFTDYATVEASAVKSKDSSTLAHEVAHRCNLWHFDRKNNLLYRNSDRTPPYWLMWWQRNILRASRHVNYLF
jgi:hypothetical protein